MANVEKWTSSAAILFKMLYVCCDVFGAKLIKSRPRRMTTEVKNKRETTKYRYPSQHLLIFRKPFVFLCILYIRIKPAVAEIFAI